MWQATGREMDDDEKFTIWRCPRRGARTGLAPNDLKTEAILLLYTDGKNSLCGAKDYKMKVLFQC
jgi:hypothetical protein